MLHARLSCDSLPGSGASELSEEVLMHGIAQLHCLLGMFPGFLEIALMEEGNGKIVVGHGKVRLNFHCSGVVLDTLVRLPERKEDVPQIEVSRDQIGVNGQRLLKTHHGLIEHSLVDKSDPDGHTSFGKVRAKLKGFEALIDAAVVIALF